MSYDVDKYDSCFYYKVFSVFDSLKNNKKLISSDAGVVTIFKHIKGVVATA